MPHRSRRGLPWPEILFSLVVGLTLILQAGLDLFSLGMGQSCDVTGTLRRAPWFAGVATFGVPVVMVGFGLQKAARAVGCAIALHTMMTGWLVLGLYAYGRCYSRDFPPLLERHPEPIGWMLLIAGGLGLAAMRVLSYRARKAEARPLQ